MFEYLYTLTKHGQTTQAVIRAQSESLVSSDYASRVPRNPQGCEASWPVCSTIREEEVARIESGTRRCANSERAPNSKQGGLISMSQAPTNLSPDQICQRHLLAAVAGLHLQGGAA